MSGNLAWPFALCLGTPAAPWSPYAQLHMHPQGCGRACIPEPQHPAPEGHPGHWLLRTGASHSEPVSPFVTVIETAESVWTGDIRHPLLPLLHSDSSRGVGESTVVPLLLKPVGTRQEAATPGWGHTAGPPRLTGAAAVSEARSLPGSSWPRAMSISPLPT